MSERYDSDGNGFLWVVALVVGLLLAAVVLVLFNNLWGQAPPRIVSRHYWPVPVESLATTTHTHVKVRARLRAVHVEADGDQHGKMTGRTGFAVAECIPELPCTFPPVGSMVTVWGIEREDREHGWSEVHPVECVSATDRCERPGWTDTPRGGRVRGDRHQQGARSPAAPALVVVSP